MTEDNRYECRVCEFRSDRQHVSYDPLGYAVCPVCANSAVLSNA